MIIDFPKIEVGVLEAGQKAFAKDERVAWLDEIKKELDSWSIKQKRIGKIKSFVWLAFVILFFVSGFMAIVLEDALSKDKDIVTLFLLSLGSWVALFFVWLFPLSDKKRSIEKKAEYLQEMRRLLQPAQTEFVDWSELRNHLLSKDSISGQYLCRVKDQGRSLTVVELESIKLTVLIATQEKQQSAYKADYDEIICGLTC